MLGVTSLSASPSNSSATTMREMVPTQPHHHVPSICLIFTQHVTIFTSYSEFHMPWTNQTEYNLETHTHHLKPWTLNKKVKQVERGEVGMSRYLEYLLTFAVACTFIPSCFTQAISMVLLFGPMLVCEHGQLLLNFWQWGITNKNFGSSVVHMQRLQNGCPIICNHYTMTSPSWLQNFFLENTNKWNSDVVPMAVTKPFAITTPSFIKSWTQSKL